MAKLAKRAGMSLNQDNSPNPTGLKKQPGITSSLGSDQTGCYVVELLWRHPAVSMLASCVMGLDCTLRTGLSSPKLSHPAFRGLLGEDGDGDFD